MKQNQRCGSLLLMISAAAFVFLTTPAWFSGMAFAVVGTVLLWALIWKLAPSREIIKDRLSSPWICSLGLVISSAYGCNFYNTWWDSRYVQRIAGLLGLSVDSFLACCTVGIVLLAVPAVTFCLHLLIREAEADIREQKIPSQNTGGMLPAGKAYVLLFAVLVIGFSAVLRTNFYYLDDNGRAAFGYKDWDYFGRYLSTAFSTLLHMGNYLVDIAPLPQLVALGIGAAAGVAMLYVFYGRSRFHLWEIAAVVPLTLNPWFLECLSFRFDAPWMAVSVLAGVLPLLWRNRSAGVYLLASALGILAVCTSYQAATGIFPIMVIALAVRMYSGGTSPKETLLFCLKSAAGYLLGLVWFKLVIMKPADAVYVSNSLPAAAELIPNTIRNFKTYYSLVLSDMKPFWLGLSLLTGIAFPVLTVKAARRNKAAVLAVALLGLVLMGLLCFGIYPVLESTLFSARAMYGFGVLLTILCVSAAEGRGAVAAKLPALALCWAFFVFALTYGNALSLQKEYTEFRIRMVMEDIQELDAFDSGETVLLRVDGGIGYSPILGNIPEDNSLLYRLVPEGFAGGDDLTLYRFYEYYGIATLVEQGSHEECPSDMPVLKDGIFHTIRGEGNRILVELKK